MDPTNKLSIDCILVSHQRFDQSLDSNMFEELRRIVEVLSQLGVIIYGRFMLKVNMVLITLLSHIYCLI